MYIFFTFYRQELGWAKCTVACFKAILENITEVRVQNQNLIETNESPMLKINSTSFLG